MKGDFHVRFRENVRVRFPRVTRLGASMSDNLHNAIETFMNWFVDFKNYWN
jgi:hypothetical protein